MRVDPPHLDGAFLHALPTEAQRSGLLHRKISAGFGELCPYKGVPPAARADSDGRHAGRNTHYGRPAKPKAGCRMALKVEVRASEVTVPAGLCDATSPSRRACRYMGWTDGATGRTNGSTGGVVRRSCPPDAGRGPIPRARASPPAPQFCASIRPRGCH